MGELFTTRQIQDLLQIDRVTVYRMLNDGRLKGVKIGNQWRFPQSEIDRLLGETPQPAGSENAEEPLSDFPSDCVSKVQEIFAGIIGIGAVTITLQGAPLTELNFSNPFCRLMLANPESRRACQASWQKIALRATGSPPFQTCHAGLSYLRSIISFDDQPAAWLVAGQYYANQPDRETERERILQLAEKYNLPAAQLLEAARKIPQLKSYQNEQVMEWTPKVATTISSILCERSEILDRLHRISELSSIHVAISK